MPWARLDDNRHDHPKIIGLGDDVYALAAVGLLDHAITWANRHRRKPAFGVPGLVPWAFWRSRAGKNCKRLTGMLIAAGLVDSDEGDLGLMIHDFAEYGPKRDPEEAAESGRKGAAARHANGSYSHSNSQPDSHTESHSNSQQTATANGSSRVGAPASAPASSRPVPSPSHLATESPVPAVDEPRGKPPQADLSDLQTQAVAGLAAELHQLRPGLPAASIEAQVGRILAAGHKSWARLTIAAIACYLDPETRHASRIRLDDGYWWRDNDSRTQAALSRWVQAGHPNPAKALA